MYDEFRDRASFLVVYIAEAHPVDGWKTEHNEREGVRIAQHANLAARRSAAELTVRELRLRMPVLIDAMDNRALKAFSAWPERIYVVGDDGKITYRGGPGPYEFDPEEAQDFLRSSLSSDVAAPL